MSKGLIFDIETTHLKADFGTLLSFGHKWVGQKTVSVPTISDFEPDSAIDDEGIVTLANEKLHEADFIITYFGKGFDLKFLNTKFLEYGLPIPPSVPHIDLFFVVKSNLSLSRKSLGNVGYLLDLEATKTPVSAAIWKEAMIGVPKAIKYVKEHNKNDVLITEGAYYRLRPLIRQHPRVNGYGPCRACGQETLQRRGSAVTIHKGLQYRYHCQNPECGSWEQRPAAAAE